MPIYQHHLYNENSTSISATNVANDIDKAAKIKEILNMRFIQKTHFYSFLTSHHKDWNKLGNIDLGSFFMKQNSNKYNQKTQMQCDFFGFP